jgi:hypothetical protein
VPRAIEFLDALPMAMTFARGDAPFRRVARSY